MDWCLYDTAVFGATANTVHTLFQVGQGADSTHVKAYTNMRGSGSLPPNETFTIKRLEAWLDVGASAADRENAFLRSFVELTISEQTKFWVPLRVCVARNSFGGIYTQAAAADEALIGLNGNGYEFVEPINLKGGTQFKIEITQVTATAATQYLVFAMFGDLKGV